MDHGGTAEEFRAAYEELLDVWDPQRFAHDPRLLGKARDRRAQIQQAYEFVLTQMRDGALYPPDETAAAPPPPPEHRPAPAFELPTPEATPPARPVRRRRLAWWLFPLAAAGVVVLLLLAWKFRPQAAATLPPAEQAAGWRSLFDGQTTTGWRGYGRTGFPRAAWRIADQCLNALPAGETVDLVTDREWEDFELQFEWRTGAGGEAGVLYRVGEAFVNANETGLEFALQAATVPPPATEAAGALRGLLPTTNAALPHPPGEWNTAALRVNGNHITHWVNGQIVLEYDWGGPTLRARLATGRFADRPLLGRAPKGRLALRHTPAGTAFRRLKIRELPAP